MTKTSFFLYTSAVREEDLLESELLRYSPMVFQEEIPKQRELRIVFVNGDFYVGTLDASVYGKKTMDWRSTKGGEIFWEYGEIPTQVRDRITAFMKEVGLLFGAFDFIQTPDNRYVFLEINPCGEWGMLEKDLNHPISEAIADALLS